MCDRLWDINVGRRYEKSPIIEAFCEFQFTPSNAWDLAIPGLVYEKVRPVFPKRKQAQSVEVELRTGQHRLDQDVRIRSDRVQFLREDETALIQVGPNLVAVNHLRPYPTWHGFLPIIHQGYEAYCDVAQPSGIRRIGLRYINSIELSGPKVDLESYFSFYPFLGPDLPQDHGAFVVGVEFAFEDLRDGLRLQMANAQPPRPDVMAIALDLDYFLAQPGAIELNAALEWVDAAHNRVEAVFEGCISDKLRELFEEVRD